MENLPGNSSDTVRFTITSRPKPRITVDRLDLTGAVTNIWTYMDGVTAKAVIEVAADLEMDADMTDLVIQRAPDPNLAPVTADIIEQILVNKGMSEKGGEAVYQHLLAMGAIMPDSDGASSTPAGGGPVPN